MQPKTTTLQMHATSIARRSKRVPTLDEIRSWVDDRCLPTQGSLPLLAANEDLDKDEDGKWRDLLGKYVPMWCKRTRAFHRTPIRASCASPADATGHHPTIDESMNRTVAVYAAITSGKCIDHQGHGRIADAVTCGVAADSIAWRDTRKYQQRAAAHLDATISSVAARGSLFFNANDTRMPPAMTFLKACLCTFVGPDCPNQDGTTPNCEPCVCGNTACTSA